MPEPKIEPALKKPKVETRDAITQTDRSDYSLIKAKQLREAMAKQAMEETQTNLTQRKISETTKTQLFINPKAPNQTVRGQPAANSKQNSMLVNSGMQQLVSQKQISPATLSTRDF